MNIKSLVLVFLIVSLSAVCISAQHKFYVPDAEMKSFGGKYGGDSALKRLEALLTLMDELSAETEDKKVIKINSFF